MIYRIIKLSFPLSENLIETAISEIPFSQEETIYDAVDFFRDKIFLKSGFRKIKKRIIKQMKREKDVQLKKIINLHNEDGLNMEKIKSIFKQIKSGQEVLHDCGLPNVKLVKTKNNEWVLFDGHHSLLAYMLADRECLSEVPHLIVEFDRNKGDFHDKEIKVFFGEHANRLKNKDKNWRDYVVNWQAPEEKQLCRRKRKNIGELFDAVKERFS